MRFQRGRAAYDAGSTEDAMRDFRAVLALQSSPNALLYIARCHRRLSQFVEAYNSYAQAAREADHLAPSENRYVQTRDTARSEAAALQGNVAFVLFAVSNAPADATVTMNGARTQSTQWNERIAHNPGPVVIEASASTMQRIRVEVRLSLGQETRVQIPFVQSSLNGAVQIQEGHVGFVDNGAVTMVSANPSGAGTTTNPNENTGVQSSQVTRPTTPPAVMDYPRSAMVPAGWVMLGLGGATLISGIVVEARAAVRYGELSEVCAREDVSCGTDPALMEQVNTGRTLNYIGVAGIAVGGPLTLIGGLVLAYGAAVNEENRMQRDRNLLRVGRLNVPTVHFTSQSAVISLTGSF